MLGPQGGTSGFLGNLGVRLMIEGEEQSIRELVRFDLRIDEPA